MAGPFHYVYVLRSSKDKHWYVGCTKNLVERFEQHKRGGVISTKDRRPLTLEYYEACRSKKDALHREKYLKTYHGKQYLSRRLKSYLTG